MTTIEREEGDEESSRERIIRALDSILFEATAVERAVDDSRGLEIDPGERRRVKAAARRILEEADLLMTWASREPTHGSIN